MHLNRGCIEPHQNRLHDYSKVVAMLMRSLRGNGCNFESMLQGCNMNSAQLISWWLKQASAALPPATVGCSAFAHNQLLRCRLHVHSFPYTSGIISCLPVAIICLQWLRVCAILSLVECLVRLSLLFSLPSILYIIILPFAVWSWTQSSLSSIYV